MTVLLGVVIVLGMLVDDAVVMVEAMYYRMERGAGPGRGDRVVPRGGPADVRAVATTIAAFLPLMLLPGILGDFMRVIPMVVTVGLAVSLLEAFWILPAHVVALGGRSISPRAPRPCARGSRTCCGSATRGCCPCAALAGGCLGLALASFWVRRPPRARVVNRVLRRRYPPAVLRQRRDAAGRALEETLRQTQAVEDKVRARLQPGEARRPSPWRATSSPRSSRSTATSTARSPSRSTRRAGAARPGRDDRRDARTGDPDTGPAQISFLRLAGGPPTAKPISVKVRATTARSCAPPRTPSRPSSRRSPAPGTWWTTTLRAATS